MLNKTLGLIGFSPITSTPKGESYGPVVWVENTEAGGRNYSAEPNGDTVTIYAGGVPVVDVVNNAGYNIQLELLAIIDQLEIDWLGNKRTIDGGILEVGGFEKPPRFALLVAQETLNGDKKYQVDTYFNCTAQRPTRSGKTSEGDNFDPDFPQFDISAKRSIDGRGTRYTQYVDELPTAVVMPTIGEPSTSSSQSSSGSGSSASGS